MNILSDYGKMEFKFHRKSGILDNGIDGTEVHQDFESLPNKGNSSHEIEIRNNDIKIVLLGKVDLQSPLR